MEKLTIEHLAAYSPYGLKIMHVGRNDMIYELNTIINNCFVGDHSKMPDNYNTKLYLVKPILYPLSHLTKEIEHNGEKLIVADKLKFSLSPDVDLRLCPEDLSFNIWDNESHYPSGSYEIPFNLWHGALQVLFKYHFDVYGLIDSNLAIDKTTII